jgi:hypothetical protein
MRWARTAKQLLQRVRCVAIAGAQVCERGKSQLRFAQTQRMRLKFESSVPANRGRRRTRGLHLRKHDQIVERVEQLKPAHLLCSKLGTAKIALRESSAEAAVC